MSQSLKNRILKGNGKQPNPILIKERKRRKYCKSELVSLRIFEFLGAEKELPL